MKKLRMIRKTKLRAAEYRSLRGITAKDGFFNLQKDTIFEVTEDEAKELIRRGLAVPAEIFHTGPVSAGGRGEK